ATAIGLGGGYWLYAVDKGRTAKRLEPTPLGALSRSGFGFDAIADAVVVRPGESVADGLSVLDREVLDKGLKASAASTTLFGRLATAWQSGYVRLYALSMLIGAALLAVAVVVLEVIG